MIDQELTVELACEMYEEKILVLKKAKQIIMSDKEI